MIDEAEAGQFSEFIGFDTGDRNTSYHSFLLGPWVAGRLNVGVLRS